MANATTSNSNAVEEFTTKLRQRMKKLNMTPRQLAAKAGVGYPYLYRVLKGEQTPSLDWAAKVCQEVGLRIRTETFRRK